MNAGRTWIPPNGLVVCLRRRSAISARVSNKCPSSIETRMKFNMKTKSGDKAFTFVDDQNLHVLPPVESWFARPDTFDLIIDIVATWGHCTP